ncbi:f-box only protein 39 [Trichonephila clavata]|uniref:F-box only protein 39 n=1 Tax=Trichonephila clavata TaxID=2740835 RepID=A0A8X6GAP3_TRICU|nr:f-box only protein 39 [Trichonephila clavata]
MQSEDLAGLSASSSSNHSTQQKYEWDRLPTDALERIFSFLTHKDRSRASIVCKSWAEAYESPSLWKSPVFRFSKNQHIKPKFNPRHVVNRYGRFFRKLTIMYKRPNCHNHKFIAKQISDFLHCLAEEGVQINSIRMPRLMIIVENCSRQMTCDKMVDFLKIQTGLTHVDFTNGRTLQTPGLHILENLVPDNVQHLMLQNFFETQFSGITSEERYLTTISRFHALRTLSLNYNYLSDEVMSCLAIHLEGNLEVFSILCKKCGSISNVISDQSWTSLKKKCPKMRVHFRLELEDLRTTYVINSNILSPVMPLVSMQYVLTNTWTMTYDQPIFDYLTKTFSVTLKEAEFELQGINDEDVRSGITDIVDKCCLLENLNLRVRFPFFEMQELFDSILGALFQQMMDKGTLSLKVFRATFRDLCPDRRRAGFFLQKIYVPRFREIGIRFKLKIKK